MAIYYTCPDCGSNLDPGEKCTCEESNSANHVPEAPFTKDEIIRAIGPAAAKLQRIIEREGDADGARLTPEYLNQLIREEIRSTRFSNRCFALYKEKRHAANANVPH